ncbi:MAG: HNH endonuclease [Alicyclobacillus sp.]|nr:HNH endonuclease [Alicyclobacillus sp.]
MAWIESHAELAAHPKTRRLCRALGVSVPTAIGHLHLLWWWAVQYAPDGRLHRYDPEDIKDAMMWEGEPEELISALVRCGFLDSTEDGYKIHDWEDYAGRLLEQRQLLAERKKRNRQLYDDANLTRAVRQRDGDHCRYCGQAVNWRDRKGPNGGTYDHIDPEGPNTPENIVVACRQCSTRKARRTPEEAGMVILPEQAEVSTRNLPEIYQESAIPNITHTPNQTIPNLTKPNTHPMEESIDTVLREIAAASEAEVGVCVEGDKADAEEPEDDIGHIVRLYVEKTGDRAPIGTLSMRLQALIQQYGSRQVRQKINVIASLPRLHSPIAALKSALRENWQPSKAVPASVSSEPTHPWDVMSGEKDPRYAAFYALFEQRAVPDT